MNKKSAMPKPSPLPRVVYEALPNDANDKRAPGSWKVCIRELDAEGKARAISCVYTRDQAALRLRFARKLEDFKGFSVEAI